MDTNTDHISPAHSACRVTISSDIPLPISDESLSDNSGDPLPSNTSLDQDSPLDVEDPFPKYARCG